MIQHERLLVQSRCSSYHITWSQWPCLYMNRIHDWVPLPRADDTHSMGKFIRWVYWWDSSRDRVQPCQYDRCHTITISVSYLSLPVRRADYPHDPGYFIFHDSVFRYVCNPLQPCNALIWNQGKKSAKNTAQFRDLTACIWISIHDPSTSVTWHCFLDKSLNAYTFNVFLSMVI